MVRPSVYLASSLSVQTVHGLQSVLKDVLMTGLLYHSVFVHGLVDNSTDWDRTLRESFIRYLYRKRIICERYFVFIFVNFISCVYNKYLFKTFWQMFVVCIFVRGLYICL